MLAKKYVPWVVLFPSNMPSIADLKPRRVKSEPWRKHQWYIVVPAALTGTGKRKKVYFRTRDEAEGHGELLKARRDRLGTSPEHRNSRQIIQAEEAFKSLALAGRSLLIDRRHPICD
jgi:hypothetical protein